MIFTCWLLSTLCLMPTDTHIAALLSVNKGKVHWLFSVQYLMQNLWQAVYSANHTQLAWSVTLGDRQYNVAMEPLPVCCRHAKQLLCQRSEHNYDKLKSEKKQKKLQHQYGNRSQNVPSTWFWYSHNAWIHSGFKSCGHTKKQFLISYLFHIKLS